MTTFATISGLVNSGKGKILVSLLNPADTRAALGGDYPFIGVFAKNNWVDSNKDDVRPAFEHTEEERGRSRPIRGSATFTTVESRTTMPEPRTAAARIQRFAVIAAGYRYPSMIC